LETPGEYAGKTTKINGQSDNHLDQGKTSRGTPIIMTTENNEDTED
jgi:hypothetical protein